MIQVEEPAMSQQALVAARGIVAAIVGLVVGDGLIWGAYFLAYLLYGQMRAQDFAERMLLSGLLLGLALVGLLVAAAGMAARRYPGWLVAFLAGAAAAPPLTVFGYFIHACWNC
jgi:hypothetical protein